MALPTVKKFLSEIFQDVDGGFSSKRTAFFLFVFLFIFMTVTVYFKLLPPETLHFVQGTLDKVQDMIKWLGGFIMAERLPQTLASARGTQTADVTTSKSDDH